MPHFSKNQITALKQNGFTMLELSIVIGIVGIIAVLVIPSFSKMMSKGRLKSVTQDIISDIATTRMKAITNNIRSKINFQNNGYQIYLDTNKDNSFDEQELMISKSISQYRGVEIIQSINPIFDPKGTVTNTGEIKIRNGDRNKTIDINIIGRVKVE